MAEEKEQTTPNEDSAGQVEPELSQDAPADTPQPSTDAFDGDENLFKILTESADASEPGEAAKKNRWSLSKLQLILLAAVMVVAVSLVFGILTVKSRPKQAKNRMESDVRSADAPTSVQQQDESLSYPEEAEKPLSLKLANQYYSTDDYTRAYSAYERLSAALPKNETQQSLRDFLQYRMALCLRQTRSNHQAERLLRQVSKSRCCVLAALANYERALIEFERKQYLEARNCAYKALALAPVFDSGLASVPNFEQQCSFLIGQAITRNAVVLQDADHDVPVRLWKTTTLRDQLGQMSAEQLTSKLNSATQMFDDALMEPKVQKLNTDDTAAHFSVVSFAAPVEELVARFATNAGIEIKWDLGPHASELRSRPLSVFLPDVTAAEFLPVAAGCAGMSARTETTDDGTFVTFSDLSRYSSLSEHIDHLSSEAIWLWRQFLLKYYNDRRMPEARFCLGLLLAEKGETTDALAQFKVVANQHSFSKVAPYALLNSSRIKTDMHNYFGARQDLKQLVSQYHNSGIAPKACMYLAQAGTKTERYDEAAKAYRRVYNLDHSIESRTRAALGAAESFYKLKDHLAAEKWLGRYLNLAGATDSVQTQYAQMLLGKTQLALGKPNQASISFKRAISEHLSDADRLQIVAVLLEDDPTQANLIQALDVLQSISTERLSHEQSIQVMLLKSRVLRQIHLPEQAISMLKARVEYIFNKRLQCETYYELSQCLIQVNEPQLACDYLAKVITTAEPGQLLNKAVLDLATVSLELDQMDQTLSLCSQLLTQAESEQIRIGAANLISAAYKKQKDYDKALNAIISVPDKNEKQISLLQSSNEKDS